MGAEQRDNGQLRCGRGRQIIFQIAGDVNAFRRRADFAKALGVEWRLGEEDADGGEEFFPDAAQAEVARIGAVRDAGVDDGDGDAMVCGDAEVIRPEFCFDEDEQARAEGAEIAAEDPAEVQREVEDARRRRSARGPSAGRCGWWWRRRRGVPGGCGRGTRAGAG